MREEVAAYREGGGNTVRGGEVVSGGGGGRELGSRGMFGGLNIIV